METGIYNLDDALGEDINGELIVIGGRPSSGKTSLALQILANQGITSDIGSYIYSECTEKALLKRFASTEGVAEQREGCNEFIYSGFTDIDKVLDYVHPDSNFLFIDYLQIMTLENSVNRYEEIENIMRILKDFAIRKNIPVFVLSQLSRKVEDRQGNRPQLRDLSGSSSIEEIADKVVLLLRRELYNPLDNRGEIEIIISKARNMPINSFKCKFKKETGNVIAFPKEVIIKW